MIIAQFITLTGTNGKPLRVRAERIDAFERLINETAVYMGSETYKVTETPEQIDALLGVTQPVDIAAAVMKAMDASGERVDDKGEEYCAGFDDAHALFYQRVSGAIEAATGQGAA
ncbi:hypothetical protein ABAZ39_07315 [Azospirillum argentinense]|uniref:Uncharacterized protein n=1 Tax=Azospirillum argentinense TaxID=2970906 RepID=A0A060DLD0_9PROT|nr:hypothetical protein [Azospirillum argentinense]AIB11808.1 hypothetical protein ABAZ39_07315 [Azospirillum argentinense]EZQ09767.1 hypothetical protein ABAZ39_08730 [Azospirillum argentinense]